MTNSQVMDVMHSGILVAVKLAGPMLILSMGIGVLIAILQAATQIHEQTLSFVPKLILIAVILLLFGGTMLEIMQDYTRELFALMIG
ncbi:MAG: flagellar biosynthetic protein FliQ [Butyricicoccus sp.]|nr:flagellar biosynthetic protein FliQ [Butyricicoccus pullicaecorum]MBS5150606.1 flagellar biosynthetic protein FliQ [Butyricicoccus pullicaecorum]MBS5164778.1 flagellar biosynthetic protein FliQ [Butyricicoccus pullicaecorum]MDO4668584.1 flagellar biosynthetic protein FliQ [Butyricicoccus pullicaecorum]